MTAYCRNCGNALTPAARFCSVCGTTVVGDVPNGFPSAGFQPSGYPPTGYPPYSARLVRPIFGRSVAGVCIGMARTYGWDVGLVRILTVLGGIFVFPIVEIAYIACWIGIPEETTADLPPIQPPNQPPNQTTNQTPNYPPQV